MTDPVEQLAGYERWLETQPLAVSTRRAYRGHARRFVAFLARQLDPVVERRGLGGALGPAQFAHAVWTVPARHRVSVER